MTKITVLPAVLRLCAVTVAASCVQAGAWASGCEEAPVKAITASGYESGHAPAGVLDGNFDTYWTRSGRGAWLQVELPETRVLCGVEISWLNAGILQTDFAISGSMDGRSFRDLHTGWTSTALPSKQYDIPGTTARYIRISVNVRGRSDTLTGITEIRVFTNPPSEDVAAR